LLVYSYWTVDTRIAGWAIGWSECNRQKMFLRIFNWLGVQNLCMDTSFASVKYLVSSVMF